MLVFLKRYAIIIVSILIFLIVVIGFFVANINNIYQTESNSKIVEIAAREISLPQRTSKTLYDLLKATQSGETDFQDSVAELKNDIDSFKSALLLLKTGGEVISSESDDAPITIKVENVESLKIIDSALVLWEPLAEKTDQIFNQLSESPEDIAKAKQTINDAYLQAKSVSTNSVRNIGRLLSSLDTEVKDQKVKLLIQDQGELAANFDNLLTNIKDSGFQEAAISGVRDPLLKFDEVLEKFISATEVEDDAGNKIDVSILSDDKSTAILDEIKSVWDNYRLKLNSLNFEFYLNSRFLNYDADTFIPLVEDALLYSNTNEGEISTLMESLTAISGDVVLEDSKVTRQFQITGIFVALLCFLFILDRFFVQLRKADAEVLSLQNESEQIFETVDQGLFLLNKEAEIGAQHSRELLTIFGVKELANTKLDAFLKNIISQNDSDKLIRYLKLLFDPKKKEKLIKDLNPLNEVSVQIRQNDEVVNKHLRFGFSRVIADDKVENILTSVSDVTQEVLLAKQLEQESKRGDQQLQLLSTLMNTNSELLPTFIENSEETYLSMNRELREPATLSTEYKKKVETLGILIHKVKGESSALSLDMITEACHEFEDLIDGLQKMHQIDGNNFLPLTVLLERLIGYNKIVKDLYYKVFSGNTSVKSSGSDDQGSTVPVSSWSHLIGYAKEVADRAGKSVELRHSGLDASGLTEKVSSALPVLTSQFLRNAIVHGIETEEERLKHGKNKHGKVSLTLYQNRDGLVFECVDDGAGIDAKNIGDQAVEKGIITQEKLDKMSTIQKMALIFKPGFSTSEVADEDSGRGMGMSAIQEMLVELNGKISISSKQNQFTKFSIKLPNS